MQDKQIQSPFAESDIAVRNQLLSYVKGLLIATVVIIAGQVVVVWNTPTQAPFIILSAVVLLLITSSIGYDQIKNKSPRRGTVYVALGLFLSAIICAIADPKLMTVSVFASLLAVAFAMSFTTSQELKLTCYAGELIIIVIGVLGVFFDFFDHKSSQVSNGAMLVALALSAGVLFSWLHNFHLRLYSLVTELRVARQNLSVQVAERTQQLSAELSHAKALEQELRQAREALVLANEDARRELRRSLHDEFSPAISGCLLALNSQKDNLTRNAPDSLASIERVSQSLQDLRTEVRQLAYRLVPEFLDLGLIPAIEQLADRFSSQKPRVRVALNLPTEAPELPAAVESAAYHFVAGALQNIDRHSQAHWCEICVNVVMAAATGQNDNDSTAGKLHIQITDDGIGFAAGRRPGVGMNSMRERAEMLGGQFAYRNNQPSGLQLEMQIPFAYSKPK
ncbi:MAG: histidine kinase [Anaerolineae bacterium]|nr:histidine kinase [Anaerolineae bacterium]